MARCASGHEVLAGDRFCGQCGWAVPAHCPYGHISRPDHIYCPECGVTLAQLAARPSVTGSHPQPAGTTRAAPVAASPAFLPPPVPSPGPPPGTAPGPSTWPMAPTPAGLGAPPGASRTGHWSRGATIGAVVAGLLVLGAAGSGAYAGATGGRGQGDAVSGVPGAAGSSGAVGPSDAGGFAPRSSPRHGGSPSVPTATGPSSTSSSASALGGHPRLDSLTGDWTGHGGGVHIGVDGQGQATFRAYRFCSDDPTPPCDTMVGNTVIDGGHAQFRLRPSATPDTATGSVISSDDPQAFQPGFAMTVSLTPGDVMLVSSSPAAQSVAYCGSRATAGACGA